MSFVFYKLLFSSSIYSLLPLIDKKILNLITKDTYMFLKYTFRFLVILSSNIFLKGHFPANEYIKGIKKTFIFLILSAMVSLVSQYFYYDVLKTNDLTYVLPVSDVLITLCTMLTGILFLKEKMTKRKIIGTLIALFGVYIINSK